MPYLFIMLLGGALYFALRTDSPSPALPSSPGGTSPELPGEESPVTTRAEKIAAVAESKAAAVAARGTGKVQIIAARKIARKEVVRARASRADLPRAVNAPVGVAGSPFKTVKILSLSKVLGMIGTR